MYIKSLKNIQEKTCKVQADIGHLNIENSDTKTKSYRPAVSKLKSWGGA